MIKYMLLWLQTEDFQESMKVLAVVLLLVLAVVFCGPNRPQAGDWAF